ncbi:MAG: Gfo/Idh/MocA family oxidoreductase [Candidatus Hydrogenedentes bacterium]|nr:Gfo/Idh/MocA family oxidoreductase [Candidatus Hydrogenedentota bacterium]
MNSHDNQGITRRDFGRATAAGFAILASGVASAAAATKTGVKKHGKTDLLKVGLLGCGNRGTGAATQMLLGNRNVRLVAMTDTFKDRLDASRNSIKNHKDAQVKKQYAVSDKNCFIGLDAYKQILATDIDIIIHGALPYCRPMHIEAAVKAKKHIFTEKPVAVDPTGIRQFMAAAKEAQSLGLSLVAGTQRRHQKEYVETIEKLRDGAIGDILAGRVYWCGGLPFVHERKPEWNDLETRIRNWYAYCWIAGDNIVEQHVHNLDIMNWVMGGPPKSVFASGGRTWKPKEEKYGDIYDNFSCDYEFPNGVHFSSFSRHWNGCDGGVFEEVVGTKGKSNCHDQGGSGLDPYVQEHVDLVNSIRGTGPYLNEGVQVAESTLTAIMGRMSAYTGKKITWEDAMKSDLSIVPQDLDWKKSYPVGPIPAPGSGA